MTLTASFILHITSSPVSCQTRPEKNFGKAKIIHYPSLDELKAPPAAELKQWDKLKLSDSDGKRFSIYKFRGKLVLINFFFAHCDDVCPPQTAALHEVLKHLSPSEQKALEFVSITIDPDNDDRLQLNTYKKRFAITSPSWTFARTSRRNLELMSRYFGSLSGNPKTPLDHKARLYLINKDGSYLLSFTSAPVDINRLIKDLTGAIEAFVKPQTASR